MNRSYAYALAGAVLTGVAVWLLRSHNQGESLSTIAPLDEVNRMMSQTRQKVKDIQSNFDEFRHVLTQSGVLDSPSHASG